MGSAPVLTEPLVGIVIVHYNCLADTIRCLSSLPKLNYQNFKVMLIDSASSDRSGESLPLLDLDPRVEVVLCPDNIGFAAANNIGLRYFKILGADYFWLLNPDTAVEADTLTKLVESSAAKGGVVCGSKVLYGDINDEDSAAPKKIWGAGGFIDFSKQKVDMRGNGEEDRGQYEEEDDCDYIPGCSLLLPRKVYELVGGIPEDYFMFFEETEWCVRMARAGVKLRYVPKSVVKHYWASKGDRPLNVYYYNRNRRLFWGQMAETEARRKQYRRTLLSELPQAVWAWWNAPDEILKEIFAAHVRSCWDFLRGRAGKREIYH